MLRIYRRCVGGKAKNIKSVLLIIVKMDVVKSLYALI